MTWNWHTTIEREFTSESLEYIYDKEDGIQLKHLLVHFVCLYFDFAANYSTCFMSFVFVDVRTVDVQYVHTPWCKAIIFSFIECFVTQLLAGKMEQIERKKELEVEI